jgi:hypothetical protein
MSGPVTELCDDCSLVRKTTPGQLCRNHLACTRDPVARTAADVGIGWAIFVRGQVDARRAWPDFEGRCAAIARRLVGWLADDGKRREELAQICWWRAGIRWEFIVTKGRDRPWETPSGKGVLYPIPGYDGLCVQFRPRTRPLPATAQLTSAARHGFIAPRAGARTADVAASSRRSTATRRP